MLYENELWLNDIDAVTASIFDLDRLGGRTVMITGAAGLICSSIVDIFFRYNDFHENKIRILAAGRWPEEMYIRFGEMVNRNDFSFVKYDATRFDNDLNVEADYIIHGASNAFSDLIIKEPVETMLANFLGIRELLEYARKNRTRRILYISSSEIYGEKDDCEPYKEGQYGYIDILNSRNSYSVGKRAAETLCVSYASEYGIESVIVRPGHIYGPTASPYDNRVASAWSYSAARGEDIVMKSDGSQLRSYCYCLDCASAIIKTLLNGINSRAYNISNPESVISIKEMAEILCEYSGVKLKTEIPTEEELKAYNPMSNSSLDSSGLLSIGWRGLFDARTGFGHTVSILRDITS